MQVNTILNFIGVEYAQSYKKNVTDHISEGKSASSILKKWISLYYKKDQEL